MRFTSFLGYIFTRMAAYSAAYEQPVLRCMLMRNPDGSLLRDGAKIPTRGSAKAIGVDLYMPHSIVVPPHNKVTVAIGVAVAIPEGHYGRVAPKSGTSHKLTMFIGAGVIDEDYRGELGLIMINYGDEPITFEGGKSAGQLIMERATIVPVQEVETLDDTVRGAGGFGSTGAGVGGGSMATVIADQRPAPAAPATAVSGNEVTFGMVTANYGNCQHCGGDETVTHKLTVVNENGTRMWLLCDGCVPMFKDQHSDILSRADQYSPGYNYSNDPIFNQSDDDSDDSLPALEQAPDIKATGEPFNLFDGMVCKHCEKGAQVASASNSKRFVTGATTAVSRNWLFCGDCTLKYMDVRTSDPMYPTADTESVVPVTDLDREILATTSAETAPTTETPVMGLDKLNAAVAENASPPSSDSEDEYMNPFANSEPLTSKAIRDFHSTGIDTSRNTEEALNTPVTLLTAAPQMGSTLTNLAQAVSASTAADAVNDTPLIQLYHNKACVHCQRFMPTWDELYHMNADTPTLIRMESIEYGTNTELCDREGVIAFPTIKLTYNKDGVRVTDVLSVPSKESLISLLRERVPGIVTDLTQTISAESMASGQLTAEETNRILAAVCARPQIPLYVGPCIDLDSFLADAVSDALSNETSTTSSGVQMNSSTNTMD